MEPIVVLTLTRSEFDKLSAGWFVAQVQNGPCYCDTCESVSDILADAMEELMAFDEMVADMEALEELFDLMRSDARLNQRLLTNSHPQFLIEG